MVFCLLLFARSFLPCVVLIHWGVGGVWTEAKQVEHGIAINHEECLPTVAPLLVFESVEFRKRTSFASLFLRGVSRLMRKSGLGATEEE